MRAGVAVVDLFTGLYTANAILAALVAAASTGEGAHHRHGAVRLRPRHARQPGLQRLVSGEDPPRQGNTHPNLVPYQPFACADQPLIIAVGNDRQFAAFAACSAPRMGDRRALRHQTGTKPASAPASPPARSTASPAPSPTHRPPTAPCSAKWTACASSAARCASTAERMDSDRHSAAPRPAHRRDPRRTRSPSALAYLGASGELYVHMVVASDRACLSPSCSAAVCSPLPYSDKTTTAITDLTA
jgi:hypothetical protein